jgi:hypothetical protein
VVSDWTFEHVSAPALVAAEFERVLRSGGWICARTPNKWGYIGLGASLVPNALHGRLLRRLQPSSYRSARDVYPTSYRMNTVGAIHTLFPVERFEHFSHTQDSEPAYFGDSVLAWRVMRLAFAVTPPSLRSVLMIFLRKR